MDDKKKDAILSGKTVLGIEFGSTRIKAVLIDETHQTLAQGTHGLQRQWGWRLM